MSLVDPKETRVAISLKWNPTLKEIEKFFEENGASSIIDQLLQDEDVKDYFEYRLVQNFEPFTNPILELKEDDRQDIAWLLNPKALLRDVKINTEVKILQKMKETKPNVKDACEKLSKDDICDIIYSMEETIDAIFGSLSENPFAILWHRKQDEKENNTLRESIILLK